MCNRPGTSRNKRAHVTQAAPPIASSIGNPLQLYLLLTQIGAGIFHKDNFKFLKELICSGKSLFF